MKRLIILRHGKAEWPKPGQGDSDRALTMEGAGRTVKVASFLKYRNIHPGLIITSKAMRAMETAGIIAQHLDYPAGKITYEHQIYNWDAEDLLRLFTELPSDPHTLLIVGHNPTVTNFVNFFLENPLDHLPTTGTVSLLFQTDRWDALRECTVNTEFVLFPKLLPDNWSDT